MGTLHFYKQACCRHNCVCIHACLNLSVCPYPWLLIRCLLKKQHWQGLKEQVLKGIDLLRRGTQLYQGPVMIISIKPVGLLNTDNVRRIDGLCRTRVRRGWRRGRKGNEWYKRANTERKEVGMATIIMKKKNNIRTRSQPNTYTE